MNGEVISIMEKMRKYERLCVKIGIIGEGDDESVFPMLTNNERVNLEKKLKNRKNGFATLLQTLTSLCAP